MCREFQRGTCSRSDFECRFAHPAENVTVSEDGTVTLCMDHEKGRCAREPCRYLHRKTTSEVAMTVASNPRSGSSIVVTNSTDGEAEVPAGLEVVTTSPSPAAAVIFDNRSFAFL